MDTMHWYNPKTGKMEDAVQPADDAHAIEMLSQHPNSDEFIEQYRGWRKTHGIVESLIFTGQTFQMLNRGEQPPS